MHIEMDYGRHGLTIDVPEGADVFTVRDVPAFSDEPTAIRQALHNPIQHTPIESLIMEGTCATRV